MYTRTPFEKLQGVVGEYLQNPHTAETRKKLVGDRLIEIRKQANLTQKEVCEIIGTTPQTYSGYEKGKHEPTMETLVRLSLLYDVKIDFMLCRNKLDFIENSEIEDYSKNFAGNEQIENLHLEIELLKNEMAEMKRQINKESK